MTDAETVAAIRAKHLKANISGYEKGVDNPIIHWDKAWIDPGGAVFGSGPYAKVPITLRWEDGAYMDELVIRVYPPERLRKRLAKQRG